MKKVLHILVALIWVFSLMGCYYYDMPSYTQIYEAKGEKLKTYCRQVDMLKVARFYGDEDDNQFIIYAAKGDKIYLEYRNELSAKSHHQREYAQFLPRYETCLLNARKDTGRLQEVQRELKDLEKRGMFFNPFPMPRETWNAQRTSHGTVIVKHLQQDKAYLNSEKVVSPERKAVKEKPRREKTKQNQPKQKKGSATPVNRTNPSPSKSTPKNINEVPFKGFRGELI